MTRIKHDKPRGVLHGAVNSRDGYGATRYHPSPELALYIEHFWTVKWNLQGAPAERVETLPHPSVHMIFESTEGSTISGPSREKFSRLLDGEGEVFSVKFTPGGFFPFAGAPVSTFTDTVRPLRDVFGAEADDVACAVFAERDAGARIARIEKFLRDRNPAHDANVARASEIVYAVNTDRTILRVEDLVERFGINTRALQRLFAKYVGVSPKWVIQRYRLHEAAAQLADGTIASHAALALELGYADQAHFIRDFKRIVGVSPASYAKTLSASR